MILLYFCFWFPFMYIWKKNLCKCSLTFYSPGACSHIGGELSLYTEAETNMSQKIKISLYVYSWQSQEYDANNITTVHWSATVIFVEIVEKVSQDLFIQKHNLHFWSKHGTVHAERADKSHQTENRDQLEPMSPSNASVFRRLLHGFFWF